MTYDAIIGSCWACGGNLRRSQVVRRTDGQGIRRMLHRGVCADRFDVQTTGKVKGGEDDA